MKRYTYIYCSHCSLLKEQFDKIYASAYYILINAPKTIIIIIIIKIQQAIASSCQQDYFRIIASAEAGIIHPMCTLHRSKEDLHTEASPGG